MSEASGYEIPDVERFFARQAEPTPTPRVQLITIELPVGVPHRDIFRALDAIVQLGGKIVDLGDRQ